MAVDKGCIPRTLKERVIKYHGPADHLGRFHYTLYQCVDYIPGYPKPPPRYIENTWVWVRGQCFFADPSRHFIGGNIREVDWR
jgi:hypothetical protein